MTETDEINHAPVLAEMHAACERVLLPACLDEPESRAFIMFYEEIFDAAERHQWRCVLSGLTGARADRIARVATESAAAVMRVVEERRK